MLTKELKRFEDLFINEAEIRFPPPGYERATAY
jgi:hypothetical protein